MKKWLCTLLVLSLSASLFVACGKSEQVSSKGDNIENELVVAGNGSVYESLMRDKIFKRFQDKFPGVKMSYVPGTGSEIVAKVKAQKASPQIDLAIVESTGYMDGIANELWQSVNKNDVPNLEKAIYGSKAKDNIGVPVYYSPFVITYNKQLVESKGLPVPTSWNDLTLPQMKGNMAILDITGLAGRITLVMLAYANGGSEKNIEPGFQKYSMIAKNVPTFFKNFAQANQAIQDKTAAYTVWDLSRGIAYAREGGLPLEHVTPKEGTFVNTFFANTVTGTKHPNVAKKFLDYLLTDEVQKVIAEDTYVNPVTNVKLSPELAKNLEFDNKKSVELDVQFIATEYPKWLERFNKEIAPNINK